MPRNEHRSGRLTDARARAILLLTAAAAGMPATRSTADTLVDTYEGDALPWDAQFMEFNECVAPDCTFGLEPGRFVLTFPIGSDNIHYLHRWNEAHETPPPTIWVEWRYRSNNPNPLNSLGCDAFASVQYRGFAELYNLWSDSARDGTSGVVIGGLDPSDLHTVRVEMRPDFDAGEVARRYAIDGRLFPDRTSPIQANDSTSVSFGGFASCADRPPTVINEWDFVRWGTLTEGETLVAVSPRGGLLPQSDRFSVTFDQPHYAFVDDITVESTEPVAPVVTRTWRIDGQDSNSFEIGLDRAVGVGETIIVTIGDPADGNIVTLTGTEAGVPAVSTWGLAALALALCTAATIMVRPRAILTNDL